jgi:TetR/AcrR family transcriptional regulator, transcriptional repressor for nem operon
MNSKSKIINETRKLFSIKGYTSTSVQDILKKSNISKGGLYNHFKSKEVLFYNVLEHSRKIWRSRVLYGLKNNDSPIEKILLLIKNYRKRYLSDSKSFPGGCIFINLAIDLDDNIPELGEEVNKGFRQFKNLIERLVFESKKKNELKNAVDASELTEIIFSVMIGAAVTHSHDKSLVNLKRTMDALENIIKSHAIK